MKPTGLLLLLVPLGNFVWGASLSNMKTRDGNPDISYSYQQNQEQPFKRSSLKFTPDLKPRVRTVPSRTQSTSKNELESERSAYKRYESNSKQSSIPGPHNSLNGYAYREINHNIKAVESAFPEFSEPSGVPVEDNLEEEIKDGGKPSEMSVKAGRIIDIFSRSNETSKCVTPKGEKGHCRSMTQCVLSDTLNNYSLFLPYLCLLRGILVGICCPDNPVIEVTDTDDNTTKVNSTEFQQPTEGCGSNVNTRIVGGSFSVPHEWSWMVALMRRNRFFCGGVIINDWYILTAAHCVLGLRVKDLTVRLGEYNFLEKQDHQRDLSVSEIKRHAMFVTLTFQHDIALLKLKQRVEYSKFVGSICLPPPESGNFTGVNATVVGWGAVSFGGAASPILRQVTIPVWDNTDCDETYAIERITDAFMCAGAPENGEDACQGDSGGPLMAVNSENRWEVIGLVSWGRRCGDPRYPGVYTRITTYLDWIAENTK